MSKREWWLVGGVGAVLFAASFAYVVWRASPRPQPPVDSSHKTELTTLESGAELVIRYVTSDGSPAGTSVDRVASEFVGLSLHEVQARRPDWLIRSFSAERVVVDAPCRIAPEMGGFLSLHGGRVAIFAGKVDGCHELREVTGIAPEALPEAARSALVEGIPFSSEEDLPQLLEGIQGAV